MDILRSPAEMTAWSNTRIKAGKTIGLVPTMGCFHDGHGSLMRVAQSYADYVVVSLFVNPTQFGPNEDYTNYPRVFEKDRERAQKIGVDVLFAPEAQDIYPDQYLTTVSVRDITERYCGSSRPGHFDGVTTIVCKLFHIVKPHIAVFGAKDFQQLAVIKTMVRDLNLDVEIFSHPIVREKDGLALSSRNVYLSESERDSALSLSRLLVYMRQSVASGVYDTRTLREEGRRILSSDKSVVLDYLEIVDDTTLLPQNTVTQQSILLLAAFVGKTRLIDNGHLMN